MTATYRRVDDIFYLKCFKEGCEGDLLTREAKCSECSLSLCGLCGEKMCDKGRKIRDRFVCDRCMKTLCVKCHRYSEPENEYILCNYCIHILDYDIKKLNGVIPKRNDPNVVIDIVGNRYFFNNWKYVASTEDKRRKREENKDDKK